MLDNGSVSLFSSSIETFRPDSCSLSESFKKSASTSVPTSIFMIPANRDSSPSNKSVLAERPRPLTISSNPDISFSQFTESG